VALYSEVGGPSGLVYSVARNTTMVFGDIEVLFASLPDREHLVAELRIDNEQVVEVNVETGMLQLQIYPCRNGRAWLLSLADMEAALQYARIGLQPASHLDSDR
jgi:hypothetical protein